MRFSSVARLVPSYVALGVALLGLLIPVPKVLSQGCVTARHLTLSLVSEGVWYLEPNEWDAFVSYRYLHSETSFVGGDERPDLNAKLPWTTTHSIDVGATYGITKRFSATLTFPFLSLEVSSIHQDAQRHVMSAGGLGDIRLVGNAWLLDPDKHGTENISLSLGVKAPTGDYRATDYYYLMDGSRVLRPLGSNGQPGDGGWGIVTEVQAFAQIFKNTFVYAAGSYVINPREQNGTETTDPVNPILFSVPDQYSGRAGLQYAVWPEKGLAVSFGGRIDGVPVQDLLGGSGGLRVAGYSVAVDPGVSWTWKKNAFTISTPVAVLRHDQKSILNNGTGVFADYLIMASYQRRF